MQVTKAQPEDGIPLTQLMRQSKAHWGYSSEQMQLWQKELTVTPAYLASFEVYKLHISHLLMGYYAFAFIDSKLVKLDSLFVAPNKIGHGYGKYLFDDFIKRIKVKKATKVTLDADPHAEGFYHHLGFVTVGQKPTSIKDRFMPIMQMDVKKTC